MKRVSHFNSFSERGSIKAGSDSTIINDKDVALAYIALNQLRDFFYKVQETQTENISLQNQLRQVENELEEGIISPKEAMGLLFTIAQNYAEKYGINLPASKDQDCESPKGKILGLLQIVYLSANQKHAVGLLPDEFIPALSLLSQQIFLEEISSEISAATLSALIQKMNENLKEEDRFQMIDPTILT
jgi:hypothetical protein